MAGYSLSLNKSFRATGVKFKWSLKAGIPYIEVQITQTIGMEFTGFKGRWLL